MSEPMTTPRALISIFLLLGTIIVGYNLATVPKKEIVFPSQSQSGLVKNEMVSDELSRLIRGREKIKDVSSISAVLVDKGFFYDYDIEFTWNNGKKIVGHSSIQSAESRGIPEAFRVDRLTNDRLEFVVLTGGEEYGVVPDEIYFLKFYSLIENAYKDAYAKLMNNDPEMIKAQWQKGIDQVNSRKAEKSESVKAE